MNDYLLIYLFGCALAFVLNIFNVLLFWLLAWFTKGNVVATNLRKLQEPDDDNIWIKTLATALGFLLEAALSWIGVLAALWMTLSTVFKTLRETVTPTPEAIKLLRFPLQTNPNMSREAVWAHVQALRVRLGGNELSTAQLLALLDDMAESHPSFDKATALKQLENLDVVRSDSVMVALQHVSQRRRG